MRHHVWNFDPASRCLNSRLKHFYQNFQSLHRSKSSEAPDGKQTVLFSSTRTRIHSLRSEFSPRVIRACLRARLSLRPSVRLVFTVRAFQLTQYCVNRSLSVRLNENRFGCSGTHCGPVFTHTKDFEIENTTTSMTDELCSSRPVVKRAGGTTAFKSVFHGFIPQMKCTLFLRQTLEKRRCGVIQK